MSTKESTHLTFMALKSAVNYLSCLILWNCFACCSKIWVLGPNEWFWGTLFWFLFLARISEYSELKIESFEFHRYNFGTSNFPFFYLKDLSVQQESESVSLSLEKTSIEREREGEGGWEGELGRESCRHFAQLIRPASRVGYVVDMSRHSRGSFHYFYLMLVFVHRISRRMEKAGKPRKWKRKFPFLYPVSLSHLRDTAILSLSFAFALSLSLGFSITAAIMQIDLPSFKDGL